ncbi:conserved hypothetical protein [Mucor ambiguus]|uniref:Palmitoyltransferase n=1 Tax=Mucor ambiguus TaxID=91626 RepID=A0A0C9LRD1_9FUNG|nr:conserved hypothetical protein [Mucor ambiguus]
MGKRNLNRFGTCWAYCCESRNPFLQIFFVSLSSVSIVGFLYNALPHMPGPYLHKIHLYVASEMCTDSRLTTNLISLIIPAQIISIYASYYIVCTSNPGIITPENLQQHLDYYKYDGLIYKPKTCITCKMQKPARSKHCSMLYRGMIIEWGLDKALVKDSVTGLQSVITFRRAFLYVLHHDRIIGAIGILAAVVSAVVLIFLIYQLYLASRGITTNEAFKWEMVEESIDRGELFKMVPVNKKKEEEGSSGTSTAVEGYSKKYKKNKDTVAVKEEKRVESFDEVVNIYDKGIVGNLSEVFFPKI